MRRFGFAQYIPSNLPQRIARAIELGYIVEGWNIEDYMRDAWDNEGWESMVFWGPKGGLKSNCMLQLGYILSKDWEYVKSHFIMDPLDFLQATKSPEVRVGWLGHDDISVHLPKSLYFTNRLLWAALKSNWDAFREKLGNYCSSTPRKSKVSSHIIDDLTGEMFFGKRVKGGMVMKYDFQRWIWDQDFGDPFREHFYMVRVENLWFPAREEDKPTLADIMRRHNKPDGTKYTDSEIEQQCRRWPGVPDDVWRWYRAKRKEMTEKASERLYTLIQKLVEEKPTKQTATSTEISKAASQLAKLSHQRR